MKLRTQTLLCLIWVGCMFYHMTRPVPHASPFPKEDRQRSSPSRVRYNPDLAASVDQSFRLHWQKPDEVLDLLGDLNGLRVADIGCGEGYFSLRLLERVGLSGKVYATDIQESVLAKLDTAIPDPFRNRIQLVLSDETSIGLSEKMDVILLIQVLGEVSDQATFLKQIKETMHSHSRLLLIDSKYLTDPETGFSRPLHLPRLHRLLLEAGFVFEPEHNPSSPGFLPKQFCYILNKGPA